MTEALDNLGRKVNSANMSIGELKGLIGTLMKSKVGAAKPISSFDSREENQTTKKNEDGKELVNVFKKYVKGYEEELDEIRQLVEQVEIFIKSQPEKKATRSSAEKEDRAEEPKRKESFPEKAINGLKSVFKKDAKQGEIVAEATDGLFKVFSKKGSGYTHDIYCEKWLHNIYDVLTKMAEKLQVSDVAKTSSILEEVKRENASEKVESVNTQSVQSPEKFSVDSDDFRQAFIDTLYDSSPYALEVDSISDVTDLLTSILSGKMLRGDLSKRQEVNMAYGSNIRDVENYIAKQQEGKSLEQILSSDPRAQKALNSLQQQAASKGKGLPDDEEQVKLMLIKQQAREMQDQGRLLRRNDYTQKQNLETIKNYLSKLEKMLLGFETLEKVFGGLIEKERKFTQDIRAAAYETAGVTKESETLQRSYEKIGKTVSRTGFDRDKFQESFIKGLKSGMKDQKKLNAIVSAQLNTEKQIGLEAGSLGEQFLEYGESLKFTEHQIAAVGRGIREAGRNSGVVGEKLREAVSSSKQFVDQMKKAGTATAASVSNVIGLQAEFQKLGVDGQKVMTALSSTTGFFEADNQTMSLIAQAAGAVGLIHEAQAGVVMQNKEMMKSMSFGFKDLANRMGLPGETLKELRRSLDGLSTYDKMTLNLRMKAAYGVEANEFLNLIEGFENSSKTLADKLRELNKEKQKNLTLEEMSKVLEEERGAKLSASLGVLTALGESAREAATMSEALSKFSKRRADFEADINALGYAWTNEVDVAKSSLKTSITSLNEGLKKAGKKELSISTSEIEKALKDQTSFRELVSKIEKGEQELATAQKAQADPLTSIDQTLMEMNDTLRNISQSLISGIFNSLLGKIAVGTMAVLGGIVSLRTTLAREYIDFGRFISAFVPQKNISGQQRDQDSMSMKAYGAVRDLIFGSKVKAVEPSPLIASGVVEAQDKSTTAIVESARTTAASTASPTDKVSKGCCERLVEINSSMLDVMREIARCICSSAKAGGDKEFTPVTAEKELSKETKERAFTPEERAMRKAKAQEIKNIRNDKKLNDIEKKVRLKETKMGRLESPKESGFDFKSLMSSGAEMAKTAVGVMVLAAGAIALAAAMVFLSDKIIKAFNLDLTKIVQIAATVGSLAAAGAAIAAAGFGAYKLLTSNQETVKFPKISELLSRDIASKVAALLVLGPALVLLGATIVKLAQTIVNAFGLDLSTVAEIAGVVTAIVGSAAALTVAASEALQAFEELSNEDLMKNPSKIRELLWQGAKALLILGPGLVLLGAAVVKMSQLILSLFNLDATTIAAVSAKVAALITGTAVIAGSLVAGVAGLVGLGKLMDIAKGYKSEIMKGGVALMLLTPPIVFLAAALNRMISGILGIMGVDAGKAAKVAFDVAALIASTGLIAVSIMGAMAGLAGLGAALSWLMGPQAGFAAGFMLLGAAALMILTPPILMLSSALVNMVKGVLESREMDASTAAKAAYQVAGIIASAGAIALSVMAAMAGLAGLGAGAWWFASPANIGLLILGAAALYALTPVVMSLASSIIQMAGSIAGTLISQDEIKKLTEGVSSILGAAAQISISVLASVAGLSLLGLMFAAAMIAIPLMWLGTKAFGALISPVAGFIGAVKEASNKIGSIINPSEAKSMSEGVASVLQSVGDITKNIASTASSMASFPKYGSFWSWLTGDTIAEQMNRGQQALTELMWPIMKYIFAIKAFSKIVGRLVDPAQAGPMAEGVSSVLQACAKITESIFNSAGSLKGVKKYEGWIDWIRGGIVGMTNRGVEALDSLASPIKRYVESIKKFSSEVGSILSPRMAAEMGDGVATILCATGGVAEAILQHQNSLSSIKEKDWGWFGTNYVKQMSSGAVALDKMSGPVLSYVSVVGRFSKRLGRRLSPRMAASMAKGVAEIISGTGEVTQKILDTKNELSKIKTTTGWGWFKKDYVKRSKEGVAALKELSGPIVAYVDTIKTFSSEVGRKLDVRQAASMARGVADILGASGDVTQKIVETKDKLVLIKSSEGFWLWATSIPESMNKGVKALGELKQPIIDYVSSIVGFSKDIGSKVNPSDAKSSAKNLQQVAGVVSVFSCVLEELKNKINPLTKSGWFVNSPIEQMVKAKTEMDKFFPVLTSFINSIVQQISGSFKNVGELKSTVKNLGSISQIFQKIGETTSVIKEKIIPITKSGWFASSDVDSIKSAIPLFNGFFEQIALFINDGLVKPISRVGDGSVLRESAKKVVGIAQLLKETTASLGSLQSMMDLTTDGFFSSSPLKSISSNKDKFIQYFSEISGLINSGIVDPVKKITGTEGLLEAGAKLKDVGCFVYGVKVILENLSGVFSLMESDSIFEKSPLEKIKVNKEEFSKYLNAAKDFIVSGLLIPSISLPAESIKVAAGNLYQAAAMISSVPAVIKGLASAISLATDKDDFFGETPMKKISDNKKLFGEWFREIANFVKEGIAIPVAKELQGVDLAASSKTMTSMANIVSLITPIIKNLSGVMGMMSGETEGRLDTEFPIDKIISYKNLFAEYFRKISIFLRDGIISPVKEIFPDSKALRETSHSLSSMNNIVGTIPKLILGMSKGMVPLVEGGDKLDQDIPMEAIIRNTDKFALWFGQIAEFLRVGIIDPINNKIGDPKELQKAGRALSSMNGIVGSLTSIIKNLATMFGGLNARECLASSPAAMIAEQTTVFSGWFQDVIGFLKIGIIDPINSLVPDEKELSNAKSKLRTLSSSMSQIPEMFDELGSSISMFSQGFLWRIINGFKISKLSKNFISMAKIINEGIVKPIQQFLPGSSELNEVNKQLDEFIALVDKIAATMGLATKSFLGLKPVNIEGAVAMKGDPKAIVDPTEVQAVVEKAIRGRSEIAIQMAEKQAEGAALAALSQKTGRTDLSGVEVDTKVDMEKKVVKAVAKWSKKNHEAALGMRGEMESTNASKGGTGRANLPTVPKQAAPQSKTEEANESISGKARRSPIKVEGVETYDFDDPVDRAEAAEWAQQNAKEKILLAIKEIEGGTYSIGPTALKGITYSSPKFEWNKEAEEGVAKVMAEYNWGANIPKFAEGGVVNKATLGVIGEAGPEAVVPLSGIEKYSSGIISGLEKINSTLSRIFAVMKSGSKKQAGSTSVIVNQEQQSPMIEIGKNALGVSIGMALAPAVSGVPKAFKESASYIGSVFKEALKNIPSAINQGSSSAFEYLSAVGEAAISLLQPYSDQILSYAQSAFSSMSGYFSSAFEPLTKGFTRSMEAGEGIFNSLSRGISSQYMSMTRGKPLAEIASGAFEYIKDNSKKAFKFISSKIPQPVKDYAKKAFTNVSDRLSPVWEKMKSYGEAAFKKISDMAGPVWEKMKSYGTQAFNRVSEKAGPLWDKLKSYGSQAFSKMSEMAGPVWEKMKSYSTQAFNKISEMAGPVWEKMKSYGTQAFNKISEMAGPVWEKMKSYGTQAFNRISEKAGPLWDSLKSYGTQAFNKISEKAGPLWDSLKSYGTQAFNKISEKAGPLWDSLKSYGSQLFGKVSSSFASLTKGQSVSDIAGKAFSTIKEYGKAGFSKLSDLLSGGVNKAKEGATAAGGMVKGLISKRGGAEASGGMAPVENVKKVGDAGNSVKGNFENVKQALKNLAEGVKSFANKESFLGALNLIPTGVGLTAMIPGFLGAKLVEKIDGKKVEESLGGLAQGLKTMANGKVLLGAGAILLASVGLLGLLPALPGLAILGAISGLVTSGLTALSTGLTSFGTAAANPLMWLGILAIAGLGTALIPLGYALSTLSPLITAFGTAVSTVLGGVAGIITAVAAGMVSFLGAVSIEKAAGLVGIAGGLLLLSGAVVAFSAATAAAGWISFFGGNSKTLDNIVKLADAGPNLNMFAQALSVITTEIGNFEASLSNIDSIENGLNRLIEIASKVGGVAPEIQKLGGLLGPTSAPISGVGDVSGTIEKFDAPGMIKHVDEVVGGKNLSYGAIKEHYLGRVNNTTGLDGVVPTQVGSAGGKPATSVPVSVSTASPGLANKANIEQKLMKDKASLAPNKSEVMSPELDALTTETEEQTEILNQMKDLFEQFLEAIKPKSSANTSSGGEPGSTTPQAVVGKPTNYYRRVAGNIAQTPGKATLNLGAKAVS